MAEASSSKVALLPIHGMGRVECRFAEDLEKALGSRIGKRWDEEVLFRPVHYQKILQDEQERVWEDMKKRDLDWTRLRKFVLFGFSDATGIERNAHCEDSPYAKVQQIIQNELRAIYDKVQKADFPVVVIAQSLAGHLISNYIWDAQSVARQSASSCTRGVWATADATNEAVDAEDGAEETDVEPDPADSFLRLKSLKFLYTTGCNIPIFVASFPEAEIVPVATHDHGYAFKWKNFFDDDDVLGWPLRPLSKAYEKAVCFDKRVNAGNPLINWTPFSHGRYWTDEELLSELVADLESLLDESPEPS